MSLDPEAVRHRAMLQPIRERECDDPRCDEDWHLEELCRDDPPCVHPDGTPVYHLVDGQPHPLNRRDQAR